MDNCAQNRWLLGAAHCTASVLAGSTTRTLLKVQVHWTLPKEVSCYELQRSEEDCLEVLAVDQLPTRA